MAGKYLYNVSACHHGPIEVIENLYCGSADEALIMASEKIRVDTLIPLYGLDADIWELGFRGEVLYFPIADFGVLPTDVLSSVVAKIIDRLNRGKKVGIFCMGGHGRTGYVASAVLGKLGFKDPIKLLRTIYCKEAVESSAQIRHIAKFLEKPELIKRYTQSIPESQGFLLDVLYDAGFITSHEEFGMDHCQNCGEPLILNGHGNLPERCPVCGEIIEWIG